MADKKLMETVYGKHHKYEIYRRETMFSFEYFIYKDGKYHKGSYDSLAKAVQAAKEEG